MHLCAVLRDNDGVAFRLVMIIPAPFVPNAGDAIAPKGVIRMFPGKRCASVAAHLADCEAHGASGPKAVAIHLWRIAACSWGRRRVVRRHDAIGSVALSGWVPGRGPSIQPCFGLSASRSVLPALNDGAVAAAMAMVSPVAGLRP